MKRKKAKKNILEKNTESEGRREGKCSMTLRPDLGGNAREEECTPKKSGERYRK